MLHHLCCPVVLSPSDNYWNIIYLAEENPANNEDEIRAEFTPSSLTFFFLHFKQQSPNRIQLIRQWKTGFPFPGVNMNRWSEYGVYHCVSADTKMNPHSRHDNRNVVLKTGLTWSRSLIVPPAESRFDLWPQTVVSSAGRQEQKPNSSWVASRALGKGYYAAAAAEI